MRLHREIGAEERYEGDDVDVKLRLEHAAAVPAASLELVEQVAGLGERRTPLASNRGRYTLARLRRGRYHFLEVRAVIEDAFGLQRAEIPLTAPWTLLVYPRLVELDRLFSEGGTYAQDGRRLLLRRPSGFDLHSVREYEQGESLRKVHWRGRRVPYCWRRRGAGGARSCSSTAPTGPFNGSIRTRPTGARHTTSSLRPSRTATRLRHPCSATKGASSRVRSS